MVKIFFKTFSLSRSLILLTVVGSMGILFFTALLLINFEAEHATREVSELSTSSPSLVFDRCADHDLTQWHPAVEIGNDSTSSCVYGHEHGDKAPDWVENAGFKSGFDTLGGFFGNTSSYENTVKHVGMKGFNAAIKGVEVFARIHLASNPLDRSSRYHSYELFIKDSSGNVSHFQGWLDSGDPVVDRIPYRDSTVLEKGKDPGRRPIVWASTNQACRIDQTWCIELWAMKSWGWGPDIIWGINDATTFFKQGEAITEQMKDWEVSGEKGVDRSLTVTIYRKPEDLEKRRVSEVPVGTIWATQFGEIVSGPDDLKCQQNSLKEGTIYKNICLENFIASTLDQITGVGNTAQKVFDSTGVELPN